MFVDLCSLILQSISLLRLKIRAFPHFSIYLGLLPSLIGPTTPCLRCILRTQLKENGKKETDNVLNSNSASRVCLLVFADFAIFKQFEFFFISDAFNGLSFANWSNMAEPPPCFLSYQKVAGRFGLVVHAYLSVTQSTFLSVYCFALPILIAEQL